MFDKKIKSIKLPIFTICAGTIITILFLILLVKFFTSFSFLDYENSTQYTTNSRINPVGLINLGTGTPIGKRTGEEVFNKTCFQCHAADSKIALSPKITNTTQWSLRIAKGKNALLQNAINGLNTMPARGGNATLTDAELERAIVYMTNKSGGNFELSN